MPERSCLCIYHDNVNLLLKSLSKHISCPDLQSLQQFSAMLVCNEESENCMFSHCVACANNFNNKILNIVNKPKQSIQWFQWMLQDGKIKKVEFNDTIEQCLQVLKEKIEPFLVHVFIKRQQAAFFERMKNISNEQLICLQVDFSENFRLRNQDAVQNSFYSQDAVSLFTSHVWSSGGGQSYVYVSNNLTHDKYCISASLDCLFSQLKKRFQHLKEIHVFSDGAIQQFKQKFLMRNLCRLSQQYQVYVLTIFFINI